jgi:acetolactate synthase-1/2/3 large subunit
VLDALHDAPEIDTIVCRQEGGVAYMADADGKMTGRPGVAFVTRGPGATNASAGVHVAYQDSTPMILFVGDLDRADRDREGFQEIDFAAFFAPIAKWAARIDDARRIPEYVARAYRVATQAAPARSCLQSPRTCFATASKHSTARACLPSPKRPIRCNRRNVRASQGRRRSTAHHWRRRLEPVRGPPLGGLRNAPRHPDRSRLPPPGRHRQPMPVYAGQLGYGPNPKLSSASATPTC